MAKKNRLEVDDLDPSSPKARALRVRSIREKTLRYSRKEF
jgi:hypothetical protein